MGVRARLLTICSKDVVYDDWVLASEAPSTAFTSTSSSGRSRMTSSSSSWSVDVPSARPCSTTPSCPSRASGLSRPPSSRSGATPAPRMMGLPRLKTGKSTPGWCLRYCQFVGHSHGSAEPPAREDLGGEACKAVEQPLAKTASAAKPAAPPPAARRQTSTNLRLLDIAAEEEGGTESDSAFLVTRGYDKRVVRITEKDTRPQRPSRMVARRNAVVGDVGHVKLHAGLAIRSMTARHPEHMRRLIRSCEPRASKLQTLRSNSKDLSSEQLVELTGRKGLTDQEVRDLFSIYNHYDFDESGFLDQDEIRNVLEDLGLQPRTREEKVEVNEILCDQDLDGLKQFSFNEFLTMVKAIRMRLRQIQQAECMHLFDMADQEGNNALSLAEVLVLLASQLDLKPRSEDEKHDIAAIFTQCDSNNDSKLNFEEFQVFVQRVQVKVLMTRREEERMIAKAFHLEADLVADFRSEIPLLWDVFTRYMQKGKETVLQENLPAFFLEIGVTPTDLQCNQAKLIGSVLDDEGLPENDFPSVLLIIRNCRKRCMMCMQDELKAKFVAVHRDASGSLTMREVYHILEDFRMLPRTREEQQEVAAVINRLDRDGSGSFDFEEFQDLIQRMTEQVRLSERQREVKVGQELNFSNEQYVTLRKIYMQMGPDESFKVGRPQLMNSQWLIKGQMDLGPVDDQRFMNYLRTCPLADRALDFVEFLRCVRGAQQSAAIEDTGDKQTSSELVFRRNTSAV